MTTPLLRLMAGDTDLLDLAYSITVRRGMKADGVTDELDPGIITATIEGGPDTNPLTNPDVRPTRPLVLEAGIEATYSTDVTWTALFTGTLDRALLEYDDDKADDEAYRVAINGTDAVTTLAATPSEVAVSGTLRQRVAAVLWPTGLPYIVTDLDAPATSVPMPTDGKTVLDQLRLIRDTLHAQVYVDRGGNVRAIADNSRPRTVTTPTHAATDEDTADPGEIRYTELVPTFDTDAVVNILTIETLTTGDTVTATYTDEDSRAAWGDKPQTITVNDGLAETHAGLYLATRVDPDLLPERLAFVVGDSPEHLATACALEIGDSIAITRAGLPTTVMVVREIEHVITPTRWVVTLGVRVPEVLGTRWDDVPDTLTWDDVPPTLTWDQAVNWHPYLPTGD